MVKLSANISKKIPVPGVEYSSQSYGASMEVEVSDADQPEVIKQRISDLYNLLSQTIDEQINGSAPPPTNGHTAPVNRAVSGRQVNAPAQTAVQQRPTYTNGRNRVAGVNTNGNGNGHRAGGATEAQCRAIFAICKAQGIDMASVLADFNVSDAKDLHVKDASRLIDQLKAQNGNGTAAH